MDKEVDSNKLLNDLKEWVGENKHLPPIDDNLLYRFLHSCYFDLEKTKKALDLFVDIRTTSPELFTDRDPLGQEMQSTMEIVKMAAYETSNKTHVLIWQVNDPGLVKFDIVHDSKLFLMMLDTWFLQDKLGNADVFIIDVKDFNINFIGKYKHGLSKKLSRYQEGALPVRLKHIHLINTPTVIDKLYALFKPFFSKEVKERIHFHTPKSDTLYKFFNKEDLPTDFGGTRESLDVSDKTLKDLIISKREYFKNNNLWRREDDADKTKSSNFRSLGID